MNVAYLVLKTATSLFGKPPAALSEPELAKVRGLANRQSELEARVLAAPEACDVVVPQASLDQALAEIRDRYPEESAFHDDLAGNGLTVSEFTDALVRELKVDAVLEKVGSRAAQVSDIDVELYYHYHPEQFQRPETRRARHILVTINEDFAENTRAAALAKIEAIAARLAKDPSRFEEQALKHSECPTAMHGGLLGNVRRGQLFPELDAVLQELKPGQISAPVESELGWHLILCEAHTASGTLSLDEVRETVRQTLVDRRKRICQQAWMKQQQGRDPVALS